LDKAITALYYGSKNNDDITIVNKDVNDAGQIIHAIEIQSPQFENITFANKNNVIIDGDEGDDIITLNLSQISDQLTSLTVTGGAGHDIIQNEGHDVLLSGADLILEAEKIIISGGKIKGNNVHLISKTEKGSSNPFSDV
jgi:Ca2+-binding RTX toxin-like protein